MTSQSTLSKVIEWPHAPVHKLASSGTYFVTVSTYLKRHHFRSSDRLAVLHRGLLSLAHKHRCQVEAWAVFSNHYHFVGHSPKWDENAASLSAMTMELHSKTAIWVNGLDNSPERQVWHNYRETLLTYPKSYMGRLSYTHNNPVKHGLFGNAILYPFCSAAWFDRTASTVHKKIIMGMKIDTLKVYDSFEPVWDVDGGK